MTRLKVFGKDWGGVLVSAVTVLGAFAAILGWIDSRMESRMDRFESRMEQRFDEFEARMNQRMNQRIDQLEARMNLRFEAVDARLEEMERRILRLEEVVRDLAERLARVEGHLGVPEPGGGEAEPSS